MRRGGEGVAEDVAFVLDERIIEDVFQGSIDALRSTREQVFQIGESGRSELERLQQQVNRVTAETQACIVNVDQLERASKQARRRLAQINADFAKYDDEEIRAAYAEAERCLVQLGVAREREEALRQRRDDLARQLRKMQHILGKADQVVTQVGMALDFLTGNWDKMAEQVGGMRDQAGMARQVILAQEEERRRVARDIHDGPAQLLANMVMRVEMMDRWIGRSDEQLRVEMKDMQLVVKDSLHELRRIIFNLRPMALDDLGLAPAIRAYIAGLRDQLQMDVDVHVHGRERRLAPAAETALFRVMQEALHNAHQHSGSKWVGVVLEFAEEGVRMSIRDGGRGFDPKNVYGEEGTSQFGLLNMRERMRLLGGTFRVVSAPGEGTLVMVAVPWSEAGLSMEATEGGVMDDGDQSINRG